VLEPAAATPTNPPRSENEKQASPASPVPAEQPSSQEAAAQAVAAPSRKPALAGPPQSLPGWESIPTSPKTGPVASAARRRQQVSYTLLGAVVLTIIIVIYFIWLQLRPPAQPAAFLPGSTSPVAAGTPLAGATMTPAGALVSPSSPGVLPTSQPDTPTPIPPSPTPTHTFTPSATPTQPTPTPTSSPTSPPSFRLAFVSNRENHQAIYLMDPDNPSSWIELPVPADYETIVWPTFCGDQVAFEVEDYSLTLPHWVYVFNLKNSQLEELTILPGGAGETVPERVAAPRCSPSSRYMAISAYRTGDWSLDILDLTEQKIISSQDFREYPQLGYASWPASEDHFVWMGTRFSGFYDVNQTTRFLDGGLPRTRTFAQGKYPIIAPDGTTAAYFCGNLFSLCVVEWPSVTTLFEIPVSYFKEIDGKIPPATAAWSTDGRWIYFASSLTGNWDIYRMRPDGSGIQNLTEAWPSDELMPAAR
jgi:hypothetical protein